MKTNPTYAKGQKYHCLTIISDEPFKLENRKGKVVKCLCDCGQERIACIEHIKDAKYCTVRCPLRHKEARIEGGPAKNPLPVGFRKNRLEVIEPTIMKFKTISTGPHRFRFVKCRCDCGNEKYFSERDLKDKTKNPYGCGTKCPYTQKQLSKARSKGTQAKNGKKKCSKCLGIFPVKSFYHNKSTKDKLTSQCGQCARKQRLLREYNHPFEELQKLHTSQDGKCKICKNELSFDAPSSDYHTRGVVDHCHTTGAIRGILCNRCNTVIGLAGDNIELLENAVSYLKEFNESQSQVQIE